MARRSPTHKRYQKDSTPKGQTRKSAASAKPVRAKASGSSSTKTAEKKTFRERMAEGTPQTAEYKKNRKIWWVSLGLGALALLVSFVFSLKSVVEALGNTAQVGSLIATSLSLIAIGYAWYIDLRKIRPEMKEFSSGKK